MFLAMTKMVKVERIAVGWVGAMAETWHRGTCVFPNFNFNLNFNLNSPSPDSQGSDNLRVLLALGVEV